MNKQKIGLSWYISDTQAIQFMAEKSQAFFYQVPGLGQKFVIVQGSQGRSLSQRINIKG